MGKPPDSPASFWPISLTLFSLPAWPVSALDGLLMIKFFIFFNPFWIGLTNPSLALRRFLLLSISQKLSILSGTPPFFTNLFRLASLLALFIEPNFFFLLDALAWFFKITIVAPFKCVKVFRKDPFLALYFPLSSSMIFLLLCLFSSAALFMLKIWLFGPPLPQFLLRWKLRK